VRALFFGGIAFCVLYSCAGASAAESAHPVNLVVVPSPYDWNGWYLGGHLGYAWGRSEWNAASTAGIEPPLTGSFSVTQNLNAWSANGSYFAGFQAGYNLALSSIVLGVEADVSFPSLMTGTSTIEAPRIGAAAYSERTFASGTVRGRIGYAFDGFLPYVTGGFAWAFGQRTWEQLERIPESGTPDPDEAEERFLWRLGWALGAGIEFPFAPHWTAKAEYLFTDFGHHDTTFPAAAQQINANLTGSQVRFGLNYQLPSTTAEWNSLTANSIPPTLDNVAVHAQTTFISQYALPFRAPYAGTNSLASNSGREFWDTTLFAGLRPWEGGEFWINPETNQGFALSDKHGVAGFVNDEPGPGATYPYVRMQRAFFTQTINLGGDIQKIDADLNQFAMSQTSNRFVITVGKFSVTDIFDLNRYADDTRTDFLNLAISGTGTFDSAQDAWGYTYGLAGEWYQGPWTLRGGFFDLSNTPGAEQLAPWFQEFQWVGEIERRYSLFGQPGKVLVTGFVTRGLLGRYGARRAVMPINPGEGVAGGASKIGSAPVAELDDVDPTESHGGSDAKRDRLAADAVFGEIIVGHGEPAVFLAAVA
jgi:high affinity Mn2+ porin